MKFDSQSSNEDNCSSSDSYSDIDVDNAEEHKELSISKLEKNRLENIFLLFSQDQNIIMLLNIQNNKTFMV